MPGLTPVKNPPNEGKDSEKRKLSDIDAEKNKKLKTTDEITSQDSTVNASSEKTKEEKNLDSVKSDKQETTLHVEPTNESSSSSNGDVKTSNGHSSNSNGNVKTSNEHSSNSKGSEESSNGHSSNSNGTEESSNGHSSNSNGNVESSNVHTESSNLVAESLNKNPRSSNGDVEPRVTEQSNAETMKMEVDEANENKENSSGQTNVSGLRNAHYSITSNQQQSLISTAKDMENTAPTKYCPFAFECIDDPHCFNEDLKRSMQKLNSAQMKCPSTSLLDETQEDFLVTAWRKRPVTLRHLLQQIDKKDREKNNNDESKPTVDNMLEAMENIITQTSGGNMKDASVSLTNNVSTMQTNDGAPDTGHFLQYTITFKPIFGMMLDSKKLSDQEQAFANKLIESARSEEDYNNVNSYIKFLMRNSRFADDLAGGFETTQSQNINVDSSSGTSSEYANPHKRLNKVKERTSVPVPVTETRIEENEELANKLIDSIQKTTFNMEELLSRDYINRKGSEEYVKWKTKQNQGTKDPKDDSESTFDVEDESSYFEEMEQDEPNDLSLDKTVKDIKNKDDVDTLAETLEPETVEMKTTDEVTPSESMKEKDAATVDDEQTGIILMKNDIEKLIDTLHTLLEVHGRKDRELICHHLSQRKEDALTYTELKKIDDDIAAMTLELQP